MRSRFPMLAVMLCGSCCCIYAVSRVGQCQTGADGQKVMQPYEQLEANARRDAKKLLLHAQKAAGPGVVTTANLGSFGGTDLSVVELRVTNKWNRLSKARRNQLAQAWWKQWAKLRYAAHKGEEYGISLLIKDARSKPLIGCTTTGKSYWHCVCG